MAKPWDETCGRGERTAGDIAGVLLELMRAARGLGFYREPSSARRDLVDRAFLAWQVEIERGGAVALHVESDRIWCRGVSEPIAHGPLSELARGLAERGAAHVYIAAGLRRDAFHAFVELLALNRDALGNRGGFSAALTDRGAEGILVGDAARAAGEGDPSTSLPAAPSAELRANAPALVTKPPVAASALAEAETALSSSSSNPAPTEPPNPVHESPTVPTTPVDESSKDSPTPVHESPTDPVASSAAQVEKAPSLGSSLLGPRLAPIEPNDRQMKEPLEEDALDAAGSDPGDDLMRVRLRALDAQSDDGAYAEDVTEIVDLARSLAGKGHERAAYRCMLVLADHAVGLGGRSGAQLAAAQCALDQLASGERLERLIDRACQPSAQVAVRASQVLLQLGGRVTTTLLDRLDREEDEERCAQLTAVAIALGERCTPVLVAAIMQGPPRRTRAAVRLAGHLQSARLVPTLEKVASGEAGELVREAQRALAQIGSPNAVGVLGTQLLGEHAARAEGAARCLGLVGGPRACAALLAGLEQAVERGWNDVAKAAIAELAEIRSDTAVPKLVALLERRSWLRRGTRRELKLAALRALGRWNAGEARRAVERAARSGQREIRGLALELLEERRRGPGGEPASLPGPRLGPGAPSQSSESADES